LFPAVGNALNVGLNSGIKGAKKMNKPRYFLVTISLELGTPSYISRVLIVNDISDIINCSIDRRMSIVFIKELTELEFNNVENKELIFDARKEK